MQLEEDPPFEVIVVDGGSTDSTVKRVREFKGVKLFSCQKGRSVQMNFGAREAAGDILLFLHADSTLAIDALEHVYKVYESPHVIGGCFYLKFDKESFWLNVYSAISRINHSFFTYGDQGLFILKKHFKALGGFKDMKLLEDFEMQRRIRKSGLFIKLPVPITTSARRFCKNGIIWQQLKNIVIVALYLIGVSDSKLAKFY